MAAKSQCSTQDSTGAAALAQLPPPISLASSVLASIIDLPKRPLVAYSIFVESPSTNAPDPLHTIELARRKVLLRNANKSVLESLLPSVHIVKDYSALYVFAFSSTDRPSEAHSALSTLAFDGLSMIQSSTFTPSAIYPCSVACSANASPCAECSNPLRTIAKSAASCAHLLPRKPLRWPFHHYLEAVRNRLINDISESAKLSPHARQAVRLKGGFLLGPTPTSSEWSAGWDHHARDRPLVHTHLEVSLVQLAPESSRLVIHPVLRPTFYLPLCSMLPLPSGSPIALMPHGVPAYYLNTYSGPTSALTTQFEEALSGLGAGDWKGTSVSYAQQTPESSSYNGSDKPSPIYIIAWLAVQNKQGEEKGMPIIWPSKLCLAYHSSSPSRHARNPLAYNPELPAQLQPSPPPPPPSVPMSLSAMTTGARLGSPDDTARPAIPEVQHLSTPISRRACTLISSPTSESLRTFQSLSLSARSFTRDVDRVASEVSGYVDSVARERERERERMKRERENASMRGRTLSTSSLVPTLSTSASTQPPPEVKSDLVNVESTTIAPQPPPSEEHQMEVDIEMDADPSQDSSMNSLFSPPGDVPSPLPPPGVVSNQQEQSEPKTEPAQLELPGPTDAHLTSQQETFDPFNGFDSAWPQPSGDYRDTAVSYDMDFNMNLDSLGSFRPVGVGSDAGTFSIDDDGFNVFTDDDFNFFDGPSAQTKATALLPPISVEHAIKAGEGLTPAAGPAPLGFSPMQSGEAGPGPPSVSLGLPWTPHPLGEGFTPHPVDLQLMGNGIPPAPDLLPPSPTKTPSSHSAPTTPGVQLLDTHEAAHRTGHVGLGPSIFDPIPFAPSHRLADGKYAFGKFALPTPPDNEDRTETIVFPASAPSVLGGWKHEYTAQTDPRIGVMRKLIGVKRKNVDQGTRDARAAPWVREHEEWEGTDPIWMDEARSDVDSEDDEPWADEEDTAQASRPSTPAPSYLPMGPTLLQIRFHHARLLPLCALLRTPGTMAYNPSGGAVPMSAPTPVSPAAIVGVASEKSKSLEAAAQMLVKEVVENDVWANVWRHNVAASLVTVRLPTEAWQVDVKRVTRLLRSLGATQSPVLLRDMAGLSTATPDSTKRSFMSLHPPMLAIGKSDAVIQVLPTALRFWEKLGLAPRGGRKDITAYVLYEPVDEQRVLEIQQWLECISTAYAARNFGSHQAGPSSDGLPPGVVPVHFESVKKTLANFVTGLNVNPEQNLVFYIVVPSCADSLRSPILRQVFSAIKRATRPYPDIQLLFHFVPEALTTTGFSDPRMGRGGSEAFVAGVYDRILQPVDRAMSRKLFAMGPRVRSHFQAPAFALVTADPTASRVSFTLERHSVPHDVLNQRPLLHVGYKVTPCGAWLLAACVDERGEAHDTGAWLVPGESIEAFIVKQIWLFAQGLATRASVEWRFVVAKLGAIEAAELDAWIGHLESTVGRGRDPPPVQVTLLAVEHDRSWMFLADTVQGPAIASRSPPRVSSGTVFADATSTTYMLIPSCPFPYTPIDDPALRRGPGSADLCFIPDTEDEESDSQPSVQIRTLGSTALLNVPSENDLTSISVIQIFQLHNTSSPRMTSPNARPNAESSIDDDDSQQMLLEITRNYYSLAILARARWSSRQQIFLPLHLAALEVMSMAVAEESPDS